MTDFAFPTTTDHRTASFEDITIRGEVELSEESLASVVQLCEGRNHFRFGLPASQGALVVTIGVHVGDRLGEDEAPWMHYSMNWDPTVEFDRPEKLLARKAILARLTEIVPRHPLDLVAQFEAPNYEAFSFPLPIDVGPLGVSGFSQIRGARLAQADEGDPQRELYSVILDGRPTGPVSATVLATIESDLGSDVFSVAMGRAVSVLDLLLSTTDSSKES